MNVTLWENKKFLYLFSAYTISLFGDCFNTVALNLWVLQKTGSAKLMSAIFIVNIIIGVLFGTFAGTLCDRMNRRVLMYLMDFIRAIVTFGVVVCFLNPHIPFVWIVVLSGLGGFFGLFHRPSFNASLIDIVGVEKIQRATGIINIADNIARISGLALGGAFVGFFGGSAAIVLNAVSFIFSGILVLMAGTFPNTFDKKESVSFWRDLKVGFTYVFKDPFAKANLYLSPVVFMFFSSSLMLIQVIAVKSWHSNSTQFGLIEAFIPFGYMTGTSLIMYLDSKMKHRGWWISFGALALGPLYMIISSVVHAYFYLPLIYIVGFTFCLCTMLISIIMRIEIASELQGRVFGTIGSITGILPALGIAVVSYFADKYNPITVLWINGLCLLIIVFVLVWYLKPIRVYN